MTSLYSHLKTELEPQNWTWLRMPGKDFTELLELISRDESSLCPLVSPLSSVARIFANSGSHPMLIVAEPEPISSSAFSYDGDRLTVGYTVDSRECLAAAAALKLELPEENSDSQATEASARKLLAYVAQLSKQTLVQRCTLAVLPDVRLEREGAEFFELLGRRLAALFSPDYIEIQLNDPATFWADRPDDWSWIYASNIEFQWPVSLTSDLEWELIRSARPRVLEDIHQLAGIMLAEQPGGKRLRSGILLPLSHAGRHLGIVKLLFERSILPTRSEEACLERFCDGLSHLVDRSREYLRTQRMAMVDGLTDLFNHRFFLAQLRTEFQRAVRYHSPMTMIMIDIDDFKKYNDTYGHQAGNRVLIWVARKIRGSVRDIDFVARYGGEEFALILPEIKAEDGVIVAEKIRKAVSSEIVAADSGERLGSITISCGVTDNQDASRPEELIEQADKALYWAKRHGRNLVRLASEDA